MGSCSTRCLAQPLATRCCRPAQPPMRVAWGSRQRWMLCRPAIDRSWPQGRGAANSTALHEQQPAEEVPRLDATLDDELSKRLLQLDPAGYFIIYVDREAQEIVAQYFTNTINKNGLACDPATGEVIPCTPGYRRLPSATFRGRTAKAISVDILEKTYSFGPMCTHLEHANYLGREFQRAEMALQSGQAYVQD